MPTSDRCYRILGLPPNATQEEVRRAYRDLAKVWHPDRFEGDHRLRAKAEDNLKRVNRAYEKLKDQLPSGDAPRRSRLSETFNAIIDLGDTARDSVAGFHIEDLHERASLDKPRPGHQPRGFSIVGLEMPSSGDGTLRRRALWLAVSAMVLVIVVLVVVNL